jgi:thioesterase domain-containing protein
LARCGSLWNMYGPTETTVWSAVAEVKAAQPVVIGLPIANTRFYVLDGGRQLVPVGVPGELYIGGAGLARGYRNLPKITNDRFLADPFTRAPGPKMYRTGDLVRRLPDGKLEFLGRLDHQLKIRGYRIELGEIETVLERHPNIERCVVVARQDARGDKRLIAYIIPVARTNISTPDLRLFLAETVPSYMIPAAFVSLASFPLLPNGKLDRKALPSPDDSAEEANVVPIQPRTLTEELLAGIWCEMLNVGHVGLRDNFFELGGHSLLAMRVIGKINQKLNVHLNVPVFFQNPTIELLAKALEQNRILLPGPQIVPLQSGNTGLPLYFVDARPLEFKIGQSIGEHRSIFAINGPMPVDWLMSIEAAEMSKLPTIEQLGERYGDAIRAHARSSACIVAGYSFSGKLAFETARKLKQAGGNVAFVLLIDSAAWQGGQNIGTLFRRSWQWIWSDAEANAIHQTRTPKLYAQLGDSSRLLLWLLGRIPQLMEHHLARLQTADDENFSGTIDTNGNPVEWRFVEKFYRLVAKSFDPRPLDAAAVLLRARVEGKEQIPGYDFTNGWGGLFTGGIEILQATGDHLTMVHDERHLVPLAAQIDDLLGKDKRISEPTEKAPRERRAY